MIKKTDDITGIKFNHLTATKFISSEKYTMWEFECDCVNRTKKIIIMNSVVTGHTKSCGCLKSRQKFSLEEKRKRKLESQRKYRNKNINRLHLQEKQYRDANPHIRQEYYNRNFDKISKYKKIWRDENIIQIKEKARNYTRQNRFKMNIRYHNDIQFKLSITLRNRLRAALCKNIKLGSAVRDLGCSLDKFKLWLEMHFQTGMTWNNYGKFGWHIDHIKPLASFNLTDREQLLQACHFTNLQPLWAFDNLSKGAKIESDS